MSSTVESHALRDRRVAWEREKRAKRRRARLRLAVAKKPSRWNRWRHARAVIKHVDVLEELRSARARVNRMCPDPS